MIVVDGYGPHPGAQALGIAVLNTSVMGATGANDPDEEVMVPPEGKLNCQMVPLGTHGVPPLVTTVVGAIAGVEIHLYFHVTVPRVSVGRLAHLLAGFQNPVTVNFTPVTVTTRRRRSPVRRNSSP